VFISAGPAFSADTGELVCGSPSSRFRGFRDESPFLEAGFDV
jgi:hypothetical protein